ncbi:MAG: DMT family transporter [Rhodoferax sp.]|jgi:drug/metabolite transporter (DMT)-like permease|nr:DMT family transporter [Rhodoferax sp.]
MTRKEHLDPLAVGLLLACCLFWGFQQVLVKATIGEIAPVFQAAVRFVAATLVLMAWCRWRGIPLFNRDGLLRAGLLAGALFAVEFAFLYNALVYTTASRVTVFAYTSPFWVAVFLPLVVRTERLRPVQWAGLLLAFVAMVFAFRDGLGTPVGQQQWLGDLMALGGGMAWGLTTVVIRGSGLTRMSAEKLLFYQVAVSALTLPFLSLALGEPWNWSWSVFGWTSMLLQTLVGAFASYLTWMWLLGHYPATRISAFVFLTPVFALVVGALWLNEPVGLQLVVAVALVAAGILLMNRAAR